MRVSIAMLGVAALALAACSDNGADADGDGKITKREVAAEAASGGDIAMRPGQWEHTLQFTEFDIPGAPAGVKDMLSQKMGGKITSTSCMTEEEAEKPDADFFGGEGQDNCTYDEFDRSGNKMKLRMTCETGEGGTAMVAMDGEFGAESFTLTMDNRMTGGEMGNMSVKGTVSGRRLGDCPG